MSAPDARPLTLATCRADVVELAAYRGRPERLTQLAGARGISLPGFGRLRSSHGVLALSVRPARWLVLSESAESGSCAAEWRRFCDGGGIAVDQSSGLSALHLGGADARAGMARYCRVDLNSAAFSDGRVAATILAQVPVVLAALRSGLLILSPSTTFRHLREWIVATLHAADSPAQIGLQEILRSEVP